ncbi:MAG: D-alanyl-D-alanine carboxypeptidase family protein [Oscillospiraceae bacterium]|jgi:D-alanyl-D-alanine carboxypeptidase/D-alanyl-D-alanine carboxypeptidase (penicillin-binding protein 5/6)
MKKLSAIVMIFAFSLFVFADFIPASAVECPEISARGAVVIEAQTGRVLFEKNANLILPMASTTKIMTTLLCLESGSLDEYFTVDPTAIKVEGSSMGLLEGDQVTKRILCYGMMLPSGNDAANVTAVKRAGSIESFAVMMNDRAEQIGMTNTSFITPSGLDDYTSDHYSTAYDMALLAREALKNSEFRQICSTKNVKLEYGNPPYARWLQNSNKLLSTCEGAIGIKTGFTDKAKRCLVSACERDGVTLICVTLNDSNDWNDHKSLYDYGFSQVTKTEIELDGASLVLNIVGGDKEYIVLRTDRTPVFIIDEKDKTRITTKVYLPAFEYAPVEAGRTVGRAEYFYDGKLVATIPIVANEAVGELIVKPKKSIIQKLKDLFD